MRTLLAVTLAVVALASCSDSRDSADTVMEASADGPVAAPLAFDFRTPAEGKARCRFTIDPTIDTNPGMTRLPEAQWTTFVDGPCYYSFLRSTDSPLDNGVLVLYEMNPDAPYDEAGEWVAGYSGYFVYLLFRDRNFVTADGSWNGERDVDRAHATIGSVPYYPMRRDGECWVSDRARICLTQ